MASVFVVQAGSDFEPCATLLAFSTIHEAEAYKAHAESHARADCARYYKKGEGEEPKYLHTDKDVGPGDRIWIIEIPLGDELIT